MSQVNFNTWKNAAGTVSYYGATAWVNFDGIGTVTIRDSENVSSITDNGVGDYSVNLSTALLNANYAVVGTGSRKSGTESGKVIELDWGTVPTTSLFRLSAVISSTGALDDGEYVFAAVFGGN